MACLFSGCASWTNPVANGIPVRLVPDELLAESKDQYEDIEWGLLQRTPPEEPIIEPEDVLGVYIVGVLGTEDQLPPVQLPDATNVPPALGFPIPVRADGTIPLPLIEDPKVAGLTVEQAEKKIIHAYTVKKRMLQEDQSIILTMIRPRHVRVLVIREDSMGSRSNAFRPVNRGIMFGGGASLNTQSRAGAGFDLQMPATEADVLSALADTGGLPGLDAKNEILIYRKRGKDRLAGDPSVAELDRLGEPLRIPLKVKKGSTPKVTEADVTLEDADILVVEVREPEAYYTAGLMFNQEVPMPFGYDLTVVEAVIRSGGPMFNGGFGGNNLQGSIVQSGIGGPSPSLMTVLRQAPNGIQIPIRVDLAEAIRDPRENILVQNNDILLLQETAGESFLRYIQGVIGFGMNGSFSRAAGGTVSALQGGGQFSLP